MGIDFMVALPCRVKEAISPKELIALIKKRNQAGHIYSLYLEKGDNRPAAEMKFVTMVYRPTGSVQQELSVQDLLDESRQLTAHEGSCQNCLANVFNQPFGCYGYVTYPIELATEQWLLGRLPDNLSLPAGYLLANMIRDFNYDGQVVSALRQHPHFFAAGTPSGRVWPNGYQLQVDQILQMFLAVGPLRPEHSLMLALFLNLIPHETALQNLFSTQSRRAMLYNTRQLVAQTTGQIHYFSRFLLAMAASVNLNLPLQLDY